MSLINYCIAREFNLKSLLTRDQAKGMRIRILNLLKEYKSIVIDLSGIETISPSFSDELFGGLKVELGDKFKSLIKIKCDVPEWRNLIKSTLNYRSAKS